MENMFCFQCEQTSGGTGCCGSAGVCGKTEETALRQDRLTDALIFLAQAVRGTPSPGSEKLLMEGLFTTVTNVSFDADEVQRVTERVLAEAGRLSGQPPAKLGQMSPTRALWQEEEDIRSLKSLILFGLRGMAAYAYHAFVLGYTDDLVSRFLCRGLAAVGSPLSAGELLPLVMETGKVNLSCMALLDRANTETYGSPVPTDVSMTIEKGPFIVVTGHDLRDLKLLLEQTEGRGINIYTHGEMLPAHGYPKLKAYPHLKGHFGTAWQNQQREFDHIPAPVLFTTNCLMPVRDSYRDRVFTAESVAYPGMVHIGEDKDFSPVIEKALALGGYPENHVMHGINGGETLTTGFARNAVLSAAGQLVSAVKEGKLRHIFLVGGCDGAAPGRNYYTEFVRETPEDTLVLTLGCGKYRFNDMDLGTVAGLPRLMDMGQCNDAYSAISAALALADAFGCGVNDLPLTLVLSWYEQKAVAVLLTLLSLGVRHIYLGPSLPAFVSPIFFNIYQSTSSSHPSVIPNRIWLSCWAGSPESPYRIDCFHRRRSVL